MSVFREWGDRLDAWRYDRSDFGSIMQREIDLFCILVLLAVVPTSFFIYFATSSIYFLFLAVYSEAWIFVGYEPIRARMEAIAAFDSLPECRAITVKEELDA